MCFLKLKKEMSVSCSGSADTCLLSGHFVSGTENGTRMMIKLAFEEARILLVQSEGRPFCSEVFPKDVTL